MRRFEIFWTTEYGELDLDYQDAGDLLAAVVLWQRKHVDDPDAAPDRIIEITEVFDSSKTRMLKKEKQDLQRWAETSEVKDTTTLEPVAANHSYSVVYTTNLT